MAKMSDEDLITILRKEEDSARNYQWSILSQLRTDSLNYYDRQPYGDEQEGQSQIVTSEFQDTIESLMPGLMRVFCSTDDVAEFTPRAPGEEQWAKEATDYIPHVLMRENPGFMLIHNFLKDSLMFRLGSISSGVEDYEDSRIVPVDGLSGDALSLIYAQAEKEGADMEIKVSPRDPQAALMQANDPQMGHNGGPPMPVFDGEIHITHKRKRVKIYNIAPEDILFTPTARTEEDASMYGYRKRATASDLREMGISQDEIDTLRSEPNATFEDTQRNDGAFAQSGQRDQLDDSERSIWLVVAFVKADANGDGISEMLRCVYAHAGGLAGKIIERAEWEGPASIASGTPILMPHTIVGRSVFDQVKDLQAMGSVITRGLLDNVYLTNRPRSVISDKVNLESLIDWTPGSPIRLKAGANPAENHVAWLQVPNIGQSALATLEYLATVRENRTGVTRYNQGLDANSLNKTLGGIDRIMSAAQQRQELIARVFAEGPIKRLFRLIYRDVKRACQGPVKYWTGRAFASCDPSQWPDDMDLIVSVGDGRKDAAAQNLMTIAQLQEKLVTFQGGSDGPYVKTENIANTTRKITETLGFKSPDLFFQPEEKATAQAEQMKQQPPKPDPLLMTAQTDQAKQQSEAQAKQGDLQLKMAGLQAEIELNRAKLQQEGFFRQQEINLKKLELVHSSTLGAAQVTLDTIDAEMDREMARAGQEATQASADSAPSTPQAPQPATPAPPDLAQAILQQGQDIKDGMQALAQAMMARQTVDRDPAGRVTGTRRVVN